MWGGNPTLFFTKHIRLSHLRGQRPSLNYPPNLRGLNQSFITCQTCKSKGRVNMRDWRPSLTTNQTFKAKCWVLSPARIYTNTTKQKTITSTLQTFTNCKNQKSIKEQETILHSSVLNTSGQQNEYDSDVTQRTVDVYVLRQENKQQVCWCAAWLEAQIDSQTHGRLNRVGGWSEVG